MEKIRCPHCGAVNQDVTPADNCWQCGKKLGSAPNPEAAEGEATEARRSGQVVLPSLEERVAARKAARKRTNLTPYIVIALLIIVALIVFLLTKH
jgi:uncharacterized membrane protein YvbJ